MICSLGVHYVFDTTIAADFSLLESQKEFVQRYRQQNQEQHVLPMFSSACPGEKSKSRHAVIYFSNLCCNGRLVHSIVMETVDFLKCDSLNCFSVASMCWEINFYFKNIATKKLLFFHSEDWYQFQFCNNACQLVANSNSKFWQRGHPLWFVFSHSFLSVMLLFHATIILFIAHQHSLAFL